MGNFSKNVSVYDVYRAAPFTEMRYVGSCELDNFSVKMQFNFKYNKHFEDSCELLSLNLLLFMNCKLCVNIMQSVLKICKNIQGVPKKSPVCLWRQISLV